MAEYATADLDEIVELADHDVRYRPVRHHFGITSFGVTAWTGHAAGDMVVAPYDEGSEPAEEQFIVVSGRARFDVQGEPIDAAPGTLVHCRPGSSRTAVATEPGPMQGYNLACNESLSGHTSEASEHLRRAIAAAERYRGDAQVDAGFDPIRHEAAFQSLVAKGGPTNSTP